MCLVSQVACSEQQTAVIDPDITDTRSILTYFVVPVENLLISAQFSLLLFSVFSIIIAFCILLLYCIVISAIGE